MDQAAADKVKQIREHLERFHWTRNTDAEWLLSQLSASEERVRALEKGVALIRDCADPKTSSLTSSDAACMAIQMAAKSLLPSPPQVEEKK